MQHMGCSTFVICLCCICIPLAVIQFLLLLLHFCFRAQNLRRPNAILTSGQDYVEKALSCSGYTSCPEQSSWRYNAPSATQPIRSNRTHLLHCISSPVLQAECTCLVPNIHPNHTAICRSHSGRGFKNAGSTTGSETTGSF